MHYHLIKKIAAIFPGSENAPLTANFAKMFPLMLACRRCNPNKFNLCTKLDVRKSTHSGFDYKCSMVSKQCQSYRKPQTTFDKYLTYERTPMNARSFGLFK